MTWRFNRDMSTTATQRKNMVQSIVEYNVSDAAISELRTKLEGLTAETPAKYQFVKSGIAEVRMLRVAVEKTRKNLKKDALEYGRKVDSEAKRITAELVSVEEPLKLEKAKIDDERARKIREKEEAKQLLIDAEKEKQRAVEEDRIRAELEREREEIAEDRRKAEAIRKIAEEKQAERQARFDAERKAAEDEQAEEKSKLEKERSAIEAERLAVEKKKYQFEIREQAEQDEKDRLNRMEQEAGEAERRAEKHRLEMDALQPDVVKVRKLAAALRQIQPPEVKSEHARDTIKGAIEEVNETATDLEAWCLQFETQKEEQNA